MHIFFKSLKYNDIPCKFVYSLAKYIVFWYHIVNSMKEKVVYFFIKEIWRHGLKALFIKKIYEVHSGEAVVNQVASDVYMRYIY